MARRATRRKWPPEEEIFEEGIPAENVVFAKAAEAIPNFRGYAQVSTWLGSQRTVASDRLRSRSGREAKVTDQLFEPWLRSGQRDGCLHIFP